MKRERTLAQRKRLATRDALQSATAPGIARFRAALADAGAHGAALQAKLAKLHKQSDDGGASGGGASATVMLARSEGELAGLVSAAIDDDDGVAVNLLLEVRYVRSSARPLLAPRPAGSCLRWLLVCSLVSQYIDGGGEGRCVCVCARALARVCGEGEGNGVVKW